MPDKNNTNLGLASCFLYNTLIAEWSIKTQHKTCRQPKRRYFWWFLSKATLFVLGGTGEGEFGIKRENIGVLARFGLFLVGIKPFPASGSPTAEFASKCERRQGLPCRVLIAIPLPSEKAPRKRSFKLRRDTAVSRKRESYGWICKQMRTTARHALPRTYRDTPAKWKGTT